MYDKRIFSVDGSFQFGEIGIDSHDIYFGTVAMQIVDALIRRAKGLAEFFVILEHEGPDWFFAYAEHSFMGEPRFVMTEDGANDEKTENYIYHVCGVTLRDFAERVVFDLSYPDLADVYTPEFHAFLDYFKWEDLKAKVDELKMLLEDDNAFEPLSLEDLCHCKMQIGGSSSLSGPSYDEVREEKYLNDYGIRTVNADGKWLLLTDEGHEIGGPYSSRMMAHDIGGLMVDDVRDRYREIPNAECREILAKEWSHKSERISELRAKGRSDREILCALNPPG